MKTKMRIARPVTDLARTECMYAAALDLAVLARFQDHEGFSGIVLGSPGGDYHIEFTHCSGHAVAPSPTHEDLLVFYLPDRELWQSTCDRMVANGFADVKSFNPYWDNAGRTFEDPDGYRVVLQNAAWSL